MARAGVLAAVAVAVACLAAGGAAAPGARTGARGALSAPPPRAPRLLSPGGARGGRPLRGA